MPRKDVKMKKIISALLTILMIFSSLLALSSCESSDAPEGMQLINGSDELGFYFYGPKEWIVSNQDSLGISCSYASKLDNSSVTLVEAELPQVTIPEYIATELAKYPAEMELKVTLEARESSFGNAESAWRTSYTYKYANYEYQSLQIFALYKSRFYIFTYNASTIDYDNENTYYTNYLEKVEKIITSVKFTDKVAGEAEAEPSYEKDEDGYSLVSDKSLCHFDLYMPDTYKLDFSSSIVSISNESGANITVSEATDTNVDDTGYWKSRFDNLGRIATDVKATAEKVGVDLGEGLDAVALEYSYKLIGKSWCVYQVLIVDGFRGYVFTFTAEESDYADLLEEAKTILYKIEF